MNVRIVIEVDGRRVSEIVEDIATLDALDLEERVEQIKQRAGRAVLEPGLSAVGESCRRPCCCGRSMRNQGRRPVTVTSSSGDVTYDRVRYRCRECEEWQTPADAVICCGSQRVTKLLAKRVCQLATTEHFTRLEQLVADQHDVHLAGETMWELVQHVGGALEEKRLVEVAYRQEHPFTKETLPKPVITPKRVYVSCDGIMYGTQETEPDLLHPGQRKQVWRQMRVGCVYWQDAKDRWHKQMIWGQEADYQSFGFALYELAVRHGYLQAEEKFFAADGADWCWAIQDRHFADAEGILDWYHATEHVWECAKELHADPLKMKAWAEAAVSHLWEKGGTGLLAELLSSRASPEAPLPAPIQSLVNYVQPRLRWMDYPPHREQGHAIGTGLMEATVKQLVAQRLKGCGMHWSRAGATAITALRSADLNGHWHQTWKTLALSA